MKSSKLSPEARAERREAIIMNRDMTRRAHLRSGRSYIKYRCTAFPNRHPIYVNLPDGDMHSLPAGHYVNSNDQKRAAAALKAAAE